MEAREVWTTRAAFILATLGFSAGIGNLWRFPYLVGKYGGGIFLLFYMLVVFLVVILVCWIGQSGIIARVAELLD
jgi:NSS family neurotransmitter:Na+ symporter